MTSTTLQGNKPSGDGARDRRGERYAAREILWRESALERCRDCGRVPVIAGGVGVKASGPLGQRSAGFSGVGVCGSVWVCPVCSAKVAATRQGELSRAVRRWQAGGGHVLFVTLTMRHHLGQGLALLWESCGYAWGAATSGKAWQTEKARYGVAGWLRLVEVTYGDNGWHVHVHALLFVEGGSRWSPLDLGPLMFQRWRKALLRKGLEAPVAGSGGLDVRVIGGDASALGPYFAKAVYQLDEGSADRLGLEVARGDLKDARMGNRTPFRVLADIVKNGEAQDLAIWHEWESASHGKRQMTWSRGLRAQLLDDEPELSDAEIAEEDHGGDLVLVVDPASWRALTRERGALVQVLHLAESDETGDNLRAWLRARGLGWIEVAEWQEQTALRSLRDKGSGDL